MSALATYDMMRGVPTTNSDTLVIGYLTSSYARATDTFIRDEVAELRARGDTVVTYSVRKSPDSEVINDDVARERASTTYLLELPLAFYTISVLSSLRRLRALREALALTAGLSRPGLRGRLWPWFYLLEACALARCLRRDRVQHLHDHIAEGSAAVAMLAAALTGIPFSFAVHGPSEWDAPATLALDVKARRASFVAVISEYTRGQLRRWITDEDWDKVHIVRCGLPADTVVLEPARSGTRGVTLVAVGRLSHEKGHLVLLESLRRLPSLSELTVVIVGDGPLRPRLEEFVRRHDLSGVVELAGWQSSAEVRKSLTESTALVMPSFAEGLPVAIMEAYASGKPVISSDVGAVAELVRPGETGWLVTPGSANELAVAIGELLETAAQELDERGRHGRELVRARHDIATEVAALRSLVREAVDTSNRPSDDVAGHVLR